MTQVKQLQNKRISDRNVTGQLQQVNKAHLTDKPLTNNNPETKNQQNTELAEQTEK